MNSLPAKSLLGGAIVLALLQGCGGGGGGGGDSAGNAAPDSSAGSPSATPLLPASPIPGFSAAAGVKQLRIDWSAVDGATHYRVLEDATGSGTFAQIGADLTAPGYSRDDISVHTFNWNARYQVQACNSNGCTTSSTLAASDALLQTIGYLKASNTGTGDAFGWSIALSDDGNTLAVGAPFEDSSTAGNPASNGATDSGAVYIFAKSGNGWIQQTYLKAQTVVAGANFGGSVALSSNGNTLAVGAALENSSAGGAYVFTRNNGTWSQPTRIQASNSYANAYFGWSITLSDDGTTLAVGSPGESSSVSNVAANNHAASNAGAVYTYRYNAGSWGNQGYLKAGTIAADDHFGAAVALSGSGATLAVGAPYKSGGVGRTYVFRYTSSWGSAATLAASNGASGDNFGATVALNTTGDTLAVGAPFKASNGANAGAAYVFSGNNWSQETYLRGTNTEVDDDFGSALALSGDGNTLAVGAIGEKSSATGVSAAVAASNADDDTKDGVGAVYLFKRSNNAWSTQATYIKPSVSNVGNEFGTAIGLSSNGNTLAISGGFEQSNATFGQIQASNAADSLNNLQPNRSAVDAGAVWLF